MRAGVFKYPYRYSYILRVDIDIPIDEWGWLDFYKHAVKAVLREFSIKLDRFIYSKSGGGRGIHVWLHISSREPIPDTMLNMLQFLLCDDHTRVRINKLRIENRTMPHWSILFGEVLYKNPPDEMCQRCKLRRMFYALAEEEVKG